MFLLHPIQRNGYCWLIIAEDEAATSRLGCRVGGRCKGRILHNRLIIGRTSRAQRAQHYGCYCADAQ